MAGYLVYTNRFVFFAGQGDAHAPLIAAIEYATSRIQDELRRLDGRGMLARP